MFIRLHYQVLNQQNYFQTFLRFNCEAGSRKKYMKNKKQKKKKQKTKNKTPHTKRPTQNAPLRYTENAPSRYRKRPTQNAPHKTPL